MTRFHSAVVDWIEARICCGVLPTGRAPICTMRAPKHPVNGPHPQSRWRWYCTIGAGVPCNAATANQLSDLKIRKAFLDCGGNIGQRGGPLAAADSERANRSGADLAEDRRHPIPHHVDMPGDHVVPGKRCTPIRDVPHFQSGKLVEQHAG